MERGEAWQTLPQPGDPGQHQQWLNHRMVCPLNVMLELHVIPETCYPSLTTRTSDKSQPRDVLQNTWPMLLKTDKGSLSNGHSQEKPWETWTKCDVIPWMGSWDRKGTLGENWGNLNKPWTWGRARLKSTREIMKSKESRGVLKCRVELRRAGDGYYNLFTSRECCQMALYINKK